MTSISVATEVKATSTPGQLAGNGTSRNIAIAIPVSACIPTVTVSDGQIRMKGAVDDGVLTLDIEYNPVVATMHVVCIRPQGMTWVTIHLVRIPS
jgi:hypothetical protein